ncbi:MAG TPA: peptide deformylase [Acidimicrobiia bacterium]|nr:peptide deformylase [Acidimicrobiia bacterium]
MNVIRIAGDPVLRVKAADVEEFDGRLITTCHSMFETMYEAPGIGLAATQVGIQKNFFVYDDEGEPKILINPRIVESGGSWDYEEGCLSIPGIYLNLTRPKVVTVTGYDQDGNEVVIEADELLARLFQHELDHLNGVLMLDHLSAEEQDSTWNEFNALKESGKIAPARKGATPFD